MIARDVRAPDLDLALGLNQRRSARRAIGRHLERPLGSIAILRKRGNYLRDHIPRPLNDHSIADAQILTSDVLLVVEGRELDGRTADGHGLEHRERNERTGPADVDLDVAQRRHLRRRREFESNRPARGTSNNPQARA